MKFFHTILDNGLTIIGEHRKNAESVAMGYFVKTGARDEVIEISGVSHFLEHMMFKGTATRSALDINYQLAALGAQANAFTSEENTVYYLAVLPEYFRPAFELLSDMLRPALVESEFNTEKKVILEEIALYQDRPTHLLFEAAMKAHFKGHTAGNSVLGSIESISGLALSQMREYYQRRYCTSNMVLSIAGNFDWPLFVELASDYTKDWITHPSDRTVVEHIPQHSRQVITKEKMQRAHICMIAPGPSATAPERYPISVLCTILGDSSGSRVYWDLIDQGLADSAHIDSDEMDSTGVLIGYASAFPEKLDLVEEILLRIIKDPMNFSDEDLTRAITKIRTRLVLQGESSMRRLMAIGLDWIYRNEYVELEEELARIKDVTRAGIESSISKYSLSPSTTVRLIPAPS